MSVLSESCRVFLKGKKAIVLLLLLLCNGVWDGLRAMGKNLEEPCQKKEKKEPWSMTDMAVK